MSEFIDSQHPHADARTASKVGLPPQANQATMEWLSFLRGGVADIAESGKTEDSQNMAGLRRDIVGAIMKFPQGDYAERSYGCDDDFI